MFKINNILPLPIIFSLLIGHNLDAPEHAQNPKIQANPFQNWCKINQFC